MKRLFSTPKRVVISVICAVAVLAVICVMAVRSTLITKAEAAAVALRDAGLSQEQASALRTRLEFDDGRFQYEVDFYNNGITYEYFIQAKDGDIIARDIDGGANANQSRQDLAPDAGDQPAADKNSSAQTEGISLDEAKAAALKDAGLSEADVTFKKTELEHDKGMQVYDIEFYTSDTEYDYEINASDEAVIEKSVESFQGQAHLADSSVNSSDNNYIGVERAKEIALNHANLNETDVEFAKTKLENDDGRVEYEIEFYFGRTEYEYTIDAVSGNIIEYDVDYD